MSKPTPEQQAKIEQMHADHRAFDAKKAKADEAVVFRHQEDAVLAVMAEGMKEADIEKRIGLHPDEAWTTIERLMAAGKIKVTDGVYTRVV